MAESAPAHAPSDPVGTSSSSEKSIPASTRASASISRWRQVSARSPSRPLSCRNACRRCASVSAATRSASPSTAVRSMRPFSKARRVNSPASAGRKPASLPSAASTAAITARPPCTCSSAMSSPVSLFGRGKPQRQPFVDDLAGRGIAHARQRRPARLRHAADQRFERIAGARPGHAHHRDRRRRPAGGEGEDGIALGRHAQTHTVTAQSSQPYSRRELQPFIAAFLYRT